MLARALPLKGDVAPPRGERGLKYITPNVCDKIFVSIPLVGSVDCNYESPMTVIQAACRSSRGERRKMADTI